jgi:hypothetical protein
LPEREAAAAAGLGRRRAANQVEIRLSGEGDEPALREVERDELLRLALRDGVRLEELLLFFFAEALVRAVLV